MSVPIFFHIDCVERCGAHIEVELVQRVRRQMPDELKDVEGFAKQVNRKGWILSSITPPGAGAITLAALCGSCMEKVYSPEMVKAAKEMLSRGELGLTDYATNPSANPALMNPNKKTGAS